MLMKIEKKKYVWSEQHEILSFWEKKGLLKNIFNTNAILKDVSIAETIACC